MTEKPLAYDAYELLAEGYAARVDTKPHNAYYDRPAVLSLLPDVKEKKILDAGCGPGAYAEWLVDRGGKIVCVDASPKMIELARQRLGARAEFHQADLGKPLGFLADESFDIIISPLALDYVADWDKTFREFHRVLRIGGVFVFSVEHPRSDYLNKRMANYFRRELISMVWNGFGNPVLMPAYRRSISEVVNTLIDAGFTLDRLLEPVPTEEFKRADPEHYEELRVSPGFLCVRAVKDR
ncbi:MAG: class I SAM-dependent methyltransferase [Acidobacteriota bacterium]